MQSLLASLPPEETPAADASPRSLLDLVQAMRASPQSTGQSVWQHGESVRDRFADLHRHLATGAPLEADWRLPSWCTPDLVPRLLPYGTLQRYQLFHDCGKPYCRVVDAEGRQHFPDHARVSEQVWLTIGGAPEIGRLIGMDMEVHCLKPEDVEAFALRPEAISLLLTGLAEIHANAAMFGGVESVSFKIKWKHLDKRGRRILACLARSQSGAASIPSDAA